VTPDLDADVLGLLHAGLEFLGEFRITLDLERREAAQTRTIVRHQVFGEVMLAFAVHEIADVIHLQAVLAGHLSDAHVHGHAIAERLHDERGAAVSDDSRLFDPERDLHAVILLQEPPRGDEGHDSGQAPEEPSAEGGRRGGHAQRAARLAKPRFFRK